MTWSGAQTEIPSPVDLPNSRTMARTEAHHRPGADRFASEIDSDEIRARQSEDGLGGELKFSARSHRVAVGRIVSLLPRVGFFDAQVNADLVGQSFRKLSMGIPAPLRVAGSRCAAHFVPL
jgi:hypothetical protein